MTTVVTRASQPQAPGQMMAAAPEMAATPGSPSGSVANAAPAPDASVPAAAATPAELENAKARYLGKAGVPYSTYAHMGNGIWSSGRVTSPRGYSARDGNAKSAEKSEIWLPAKDELPLGGIKSS